MLENSKLGFFAQLKSYPREFWVANTMEIFERLSWYGWFTVMALYVTAKPETGGLGFSTETRGNLQGIVPFFLYLLPVLTGALADRYGYKKMFIIAYLVMIVSYYSLGQFTSLPGVLHGLHVRGGRGGHFQTGGGGHDRQGHKRIELGLGVRHLLHDGERGRVPRSDRGGHCPRLVVGLCVHRLLHLGVHQPFDRHLLLQRPFDRGAVGSTPHITQGA